LSSVRARPSGWKVDPDDPAGPAGPLPEWVEGTEVISREVTLPGGKTYVKYTLDGVDIDPDTIETLGLS
jgi:hypothetical protein